ncbi:MAG: tRNA (guanosine(46)-N7)-methyltransferase TrmB [Flavobacteriales bacterium]|nr:tRNA (guanosine(46)-N7)-methyltransferase TrmB [Flavobacteriales bacterium]
MGRKKKLLRFADMQKFPNAFEPEMEAFFDRAIGGVKRHPLAGNWNSQVFKNNHPIVLELGCGKGEYSVGMGRKFPNKNFIGMDIKGARIWFGAKEALETGLKNVAFLRTRIDFISAFFAEGEVDEIWITFPDPQERENRARKRLTSKLFIDRYRQFLKPNGLIHLKTDSAFLYNFTLDEVNLYGYELVDHTPDLYGSSIEKYDLDTQEILNIKTYYEGVFTEKGHIITYIKFRV